MSGQIRSVGTTPTEVELFIGALMFSTIDEVRDVLRHVVDDDVEHPASAVLSSIRALAGRGVITSPQLVHDDLLRRGKLNRQVAVWLTAATTSGSCASAARNYAAAVVAQAFRRHVESFGNALRQESQIGAEVDVAHLAEQASTRIASVYARLEKLRGDAA